ncbi:hypothetical protein E2I00_016008 [Balaenoptera physalus]|uniref:Ribosomal protein L23/L25 N-terminal domain-containing protein n=1 Tax=Balaenoptera physalus TaxID=9770 RepID=A0A6A1QCV5_BALPH|nr:hypothetical protein E2I00_016008 [Balaenoptera physalus]
MAPKAEKEAPAPPKAKAKAKALKAKKAVSIATNTATKKRSSHHPPSDGPKHCSSGGSPNILRRAPLGETSLTPMPSSTSPLTTAKWKTTHVFIVDVKANKHQIKQAVKKLHDIDMAKVNTLIRPDGEKKAYV